MTNDQPGNGAKRVAFAEDTLKHAARDGSPSIRETRAGQDIGAAVSVPEEARALHAPATQNFQNRMDAVFGALGGSSQGGWSLNPSPAFNPGKAVPAAETDDRDDDADAMDVAKSISRPLMSGDVWALDEDEADGAGCDLGVSHSFRQAFEDEQEADEYDRVAVTAFEEDRSESRMLRHMEVAEDNIFERMCHVRQHLVAPDANIPTPMDVEEQPSAARPPSALSAEPKRTKEKRRVRFTLDTTDGGDDGGPKAQKASEDANPGEVYRMARFEPTSASTSRTDRDGGRQSSHQHVASSHYSQSAAPHRHQGAEKGWQGDGGYGRRASCRRGRRVPDHVVNPHKWTCYTLDEPIYVGQTASRIADSDQEQWQAVASVEAAAVGAASTDPTPSSMAAEPRFDPSGQAGIKFRRKEAPSKREGHDVGGASVRPERSRLLGSLHDVEGEDKEESLHTPGLASAVQFDSTTGRKRHLRTKMSVEETDAETT